MTSPTAVPPSSPTAAVPDLGPAVVRTATPYVVSAVVSWAVTGQVERALGVSAESGRAAITSAATAVLGTAYYLAVRALEARFPALGWLLGKPGAPTYPTPGGADPDGPTLLPKDPVPPAS